MSDSHSFLFSAVMTRLLTLPKSIVSEILCHCTPEERKTFRLLNHWTRTFIDTTYYMWIPPESSEVTVKKTKKESAMQQGACKYRKVKSDFVNLFDPQKHPLVHR